jgi:hypothetical protein
MILHDKIIHSVADLEQTLQAWGSYWRNAAAFPALSYDGEVGISLTLVKKECLGGSEVYEIEVSKASLACFPHSGRYKGRQATASERRLERREFEARSLHSSVEPEGSEGGGLKGKEALRSSGRKGLESLGSSVNGGLEGEGLDSSVKGKREGGRIRTIRSGGRTHRLETGVKRPLYSSG